MTNSNPNQDTNKDMYYGFNPTKNVVIAFEKKEGLTAFLEHDPKKYGEPETINQQHLRKEISIQEKDERTQGSNSSGFHVSPGNQYKELVDKVVNDISNDNQEYIHFKRKGFNSIGIIAKMSSEKYNELQKEYQSVLEKNQVIKLDKSKIDEKNLIVTASINGNVMDHRDNSNQMDSKTSSQKFMMKLQTVMDKENFKHLNPDYSRFAMVSTIEGENKKNPAIYKFRSTTARDKFVDTAKKIIASDNGKEFPQSISNFNGITTMHVKQRKVIDLTNVQKGNKEIENLIHDYRETVKNRKIEQTTQQTNPYRKTPTPKQTRTI